MKSKKTLAKLKFDSCLSCFSTIKPANCFLQCSHRYHLDCIKEWIASSTVCFECDEIITNLYIETPEDCEMLYTNQIRTHYSKKRLSRITTSSLKRIIAELIDNSMTHNPSSTSYRVALRDIITAKHMIKALRNKKKANGCKTDYLLEITNRQLLQIRKSLQNEYQKIIDEESKHENFVDA